MGEVKKRTVVIASVLKTVNDTRMFEKIGITLSNTKSYVVHIIGFPSANTPQTEIQLHALNSFSRLSFERLLAPWKILRQVLRVKPSLLIITTHELLVPALIAKLCIKCRIIYDIQENYFRNILFTNAFISIARPFIALYVRSKEILTSPFIDHFFLAERQYEQELNFPGKRKTILENKVKKFVSAERNWIPLTEKESIELLFSGTLADTTGVFIALQMAVALHRLDRRIRLIIIGYCAQKSTLETLKKAVSEHSFVQLIGGETLVPHHEILSQIQKSDFGIIAYPPNPSTRGSIPTKLYEYLGLHLPIILINHKPWIQLCEPYQAAIVFDYPDFNAAKVYQALITQEFYTQNPANVFWDAEEPKLLNAVESLF